MKAERIYDVDLIKSVIEHPEIFNCVKEDHIDRFNPEPEKDCYVLISKDSETVGIYILHPHNSVTLEIHAHILPEQREKNALESGKMVLRWLVDNFPQYQKVVAQVPECYMNVVNFCLANNFKREGVNRKSYLRDGKLLDQFNLGQTREEIEEFLKCHL